MMAECYTRLEQYNHAQITLNVLSKMTVNADHRQRWTEKIRCKINELQNFGMQTKNSVETIPNLGKILGILFLAVCIASNDTLNSPRTLGTYLLENFA